jgi:hypothetical protein
MALSKGVALIRIGALSICSIMSPVCANPHAHVSCHQGVAEFGDTQEWPICASAVDPEITRLYCTGTISPSSTPLSTALPDP